MTAPAPQNIFDRVAETCSAPGTGAVTLAGAKTGYRSFGSVLSNGSLVYYTIADQSGANWETGIATWNTGGTLTRTAANVQSGSAGAGALTNFSSGAQDVFLTVPAAPLTQPQIWQDRCALLEPDAIESYQVNTFSLSIAANSRRWMTAGWQTQLNGVGRLEARNPMQPVPLCGVTLSGTASGSTAVILNPATPVYADPKSLYYQREFQLISSQMQYLGMPLGTSAQVLPFLPGPYGAIILHATNFDAPWLILRNNNGINNFNLGDEINDTQTQRKSCPLRLAVNLKVVNEIANTAPAATGASAGILYYLCPSTWSVIADPLKPYAFSDDFMGASLDTVGTWNRVQSTVGNVEIATQYAWCALVGNNSWTTNGAYAKTSFTRAAGKKYLFDVYMGNGTTANCIVGLSDGAAFNYTDFAHGLIFQASGGGTLHAFENGTDRGAVGTGVLPGSGTYRVRFTPSTSGQGCTYEIQGGTQYPAIGGASWTNITPAGSSSATNTFFPGFQGNLGTCYIGFPRVY